MGVVVGRSGGRRHLRCTGQGSCASSHVSPPSRAASAASTAPLLPRPRSPAGSAAIAGRLILARVRISELWVRLEAALGRTTAESWATDFVITELDGRTVRQALADGESPVTVWRAVHAALDLPAAQR